MQTVNLKSSLTVKGESILATGNLHIYYIITQKERRQ